MKLSELTIGTEYAVIPSWTYTNKSARNVDTCRENDVVKAELVSKDKYEYQPSQRFKAIDTNFRKAQQGERSVGVLMKATDSNGVDIYWTARLADIVAPYATLEPKWTEKQLRENAEAEERKRLEAIKEAKQRVVREYVARCQKTVPASLNELIGRRCRKVTVTTSGGYADNELIAVVEISLEDMETLIELAYQGKEAVA